MSNAVSSCFVEDLLSGETALATIPNAELLLTCSATQLEQVAFNCFLACNFLSDSSLFNADTLQAFIKRVAASYTTAPYHNFCHAVTVLTSAATLLQTCTIELSMLDKYILMLAAICHDLVRCVLPLDECWCLAGVAARLGAVRDCCRVPLLLEKACSRVTGTAAIAGLRRRTSCFCEELSPHIAFVEYSFQHAKDNIFVDCICQYSIPKEHPGIPNVELARRGSAWVDSYGASSALEKRSCAAFEEILAIDGCNVLESLDETARSAVVAGVVELILATDITNTELHATLKVQFDEMISEFAASTSALARPLPLLTLMMLCADLGVLVGSFEVFLAWGRRLFQEIRSWNPSASAPSFAAAQSMFLTHHPAHIFDVLSKVPGCASYGPAFISTATTWAALGPEAQIDIMS